MKKRTHQILFILLLFMSCITARAHDIEVANSDGVTIYYLWMNDETELAVTYRGSYYSSYSNEYSGSVVIPESVTYGDQTYPVTSIGGIAFYGCTGLTAVTIPNSVTTIGNTAFRGCTGLTSVTIPNSVTTIGNSAFSNCTGLTSVTIPNSVTSIGNYAFYDCTGLTSVTIPNSVTSIGYIAFAYCSGLTSMAVDSGNAYYDSRDNCNAIIETATNTLIAGCKNTIIPNSVTSFGDAAFEGCTGLTSVTIPNSVASISNSAFALCTGLTSVTIPNSVTFIGDYAFRGCTGLTSVTIPNSVTIIDKKAFENCTGLTKIKCLAQTPPTCGDNVFLNVPTSTCVLEVPAGTIDAYAAANGWSAFKLVEEIENLSLDGINYHITSEEDKTVEVIPLGENNYYQGDIIIPSSVVLNGITYSVTSIGEKAFYNCTGLTSIEIPNSVTSIGSQAFYLCRGLTAVTIGSGVTNIGERAFSSCRELTSIEIPNSVTSIGSRAFSNCSGLTSVTIPNSVTSIGGSAFTSCRGLTSVTIPNSVTSIDNYAFAGCSGLTAISVASGNPNYDSREGCNAIIETATNTLIAGCKNTVIPNSVTTIYAAFYECTDLTFIEIPNSVTSIGRSAFAYCSGLTSVTIPNSVTSIGDWAFSYCSGLSSIEIPNSLTGIGSYAFYGCTGLTSVTIPNSVTSIGDWAFSYCSGLSSIEIPNSLTSIAVSAFRGCTGLTSVTIPNSVTSIGDQAFIGCTGLTSVTIPNSVTTIGEGAFYYCTGLTKIKCLAQTPPTCGDNVFYNVPTSTCVLEVPQGTVPDYQAADYWKDFVNIKEIALLGDADNSGVVNINDVVCIINHILNKENITFIEDVADVDGSGAININDVVVLIDRYILMRNNAPAQEEASKAPMLAMADDNYLHLADIDIQPGETKTIEMLMTNANEVKAIQGNIKLPAGLSFVTKSNGKVDAKNIDDRAEDFTLSCGIQTDGSLTFAQYSGDGFTYEGNSGGIFTFKIKADDSATPGSYSIDLTDMVLSIGGVGYDIPNRSSSITIGGSTGIEVIDNGQLTIDNGDNKIYTLDGKQLEHLQKCVNIVRTKDGTVKKVMIK